MRRVAVILLNWNGWRDTVAAVESVERQRVPASWIVVVDNASTDGSEAELRARCPRAVVLQSGANLGFAGGNNVGVRWSLAQGADAVWLLNNDAVADEGALGALIEVDEQRPDAGAIGARIYEYAERERLQCWGGGWINLWAGRAREFNRRVSEEQLDYISGCALYLPRRAIERSGMLDEGFFMYFEDAELSLRYREQGWSLAVAPDAKVFHKGGASARPGRRQARWRTQSLLRVLRLHAPSYLASMTLSSALRGASMLAHRDWSQLRALVEDVAAFAREPDWRRSSG
ncbi:MAG: glycosyltransferase family 2 protein [Myxococcota bacterium]